ncbi:MAG: hypothetical protein KKB20_19945 [Proteobacteria bacterium]|nr:hypothetical protein [Pseudomonadota bacterium]
MTEPKSPCTGHLEKICLDNECSEAWEKISPAMAEHLADFIFCPFCAEELHLQCSACKEGLTNKDFKYCPWCGCEFEDGATVS